MFLVEISTRHAARRAAADCKRFALPAEASEVPRGVASDNRRVIAGQSLISLGVKPNCSNSRSNIT